MPEPLRILAGEDRPSTVVEPKPRATGLSLDEIVAGHLDYLHHEAFFVVSPTFEVTAYRTLWFGLQYDSVLLQPWIYGFVFHESTYFILDNYLGECKVHSAYLARPSVRALPLDPFNTEDRFSRSLSADAVGIGSSPRHPQHCGPLSHGRVGYWLRAVG